jgi:hypothetical protein
VLVEALVAQATIERFHKAILLRLYGCDVMLFDARVLAPGQNGVTGQFGPIVAYNPPRLRAVSRSSRYNPTSLQVHYLALSLEQDRQTSIVEATTLVGDLAHPQTHSVVLPAKRLILPCRPVDPDQPAGATLPRSRDRPLAALSQRSIPQTGSVFPSRSFNADTFSIGSRPRAPATARGRTPTGRRTSTSGCKRPHR